MNKKHLSYLLSLSLLTISSTSFAGERFNGNDRALQHRDTYTIKKSGDNSYEFKKVSDFGTFKVIKDQDYILTPKEVPNYTRYLGKQVTIGQKVTDIRTEKSLSLISDKLNRSRLQDVILNVNTPIYTTIRYSFNEALAKQKLKKNDKFDFVDYRDSHGKEVIQSIYGINIIKNESQDLISKGYKNSTQRFLTDGKFDKTKYIDELQMQLDIKYPDIFKIITVENYPY